MEFDIKKNAHNQRFELIMGEAVARLVKTPSRAER